MNNHNKYNVELIIKLEDFIDSNYEEILKKSKKNDYFSYCQVLSTEAKKEIEEGNDKKGKVLYLLSDICSFLLNPKSLKNPYTPFMIMANGFRSAAVEDFTEEDIIFFENIVEYCSNNMLQARIADILWLLKKKKNIKHLEIAVCNYMKFPIDNNSVHTKNYMERAIKLNLLAKKSIDETQEFLLNIFFETKLEDNLQCLDISKLLLLTKINNEQILEVAKKLELFAEKSEKVIGFWKARLYYHSAKNWYERINNRDNVNKLIEKMAESFVNEAKHVDSNIARAKFYENAIQEYRSIPVKDRVILNIDNRINEIYQQMVNSNNLIRNEMHSLKTDCIDISELVLNSIEEIRDKNIDEALLSFVDITYTSDFNKLRKTSEERLNSSLSRLFETIHYSEDNRVIAKTSGGLQNSGKDYEHQVEAQIQKEYSLDIEFAIKGCIYPAFEQFIFEHRVTKEYIQTICLNSSIIPRDRVLIWTEGLYFGFEKNFLVSTHLLIPQIEHLIRVVLKQNGIKTTILETNGIEVEKGLSTLLEDSQLEEFVDKNIVFELKFLLTKSIGYNLRNNVAHGLSSYNIFLSTQSMYLWWFILKLVVFNSLWEKEYI